MQEGPGLLLVGQGISADGRGCGGEGKGGLAAPRSVGRHPFPGWDGPPLPVSKGGWKVVGGGTGWERAVEMGFQQLVWLLSSSLRSSQAQSSRCLGLWL